MSSSNLSAQDSGGPRVLAVRGAGALPPLFEVRTDTQHSRGLESASAAPGAAPDFAPTVVDASMTVVEVALANLRRYWAAWHLHEAGARLGDDPEELHDLRVAGCRLDAILRQFKPYLPASIVQI